MAKQKAKEKPPSSRFWFMMNVIAFLSVPVFCILSFLWIRADVQNTLIDDFDATPAAWHECSFALVDSSEQITLMRRRLPGIIHAEYEFQMLIHTMEGVFTIVSWGYTETKITDVYTSTALLRDNRPVSLLRVESYGSTYYFDLERMQELTFIDLNDEVDSAHLGHFDGVDKFIPSHPSVTTLPNQCGIQSSDE